MFNILMCDPVNQEINNYIIEKVNTLKARGITPKLAVVRAGDDASLVNYEKAINLHSEKLGINTQLITMAEDTSQAYIKAALQFVNNDDEVHGIILLRPFPEQIDEAELRDMLNPEKDVDAITETSMARTFVGKKDVFHACTAEACMEVAKFYGIELEGKKVTIIGRSLTVGKPLSMMMLNENATVTVCHSYTSKEDQITACKNADIVVLATGNKSYYGSEYFRNGQVVLDVGSSIDENGKLCGDLNIDEIEHSGVITDFSYTPVPGGIGKVTTALLLRNIITAAEKRHNI